jgi:hypothetical protein
MSAVAGVAVKIGSRVSEKKISASWLDISVRNWILAAYKALFGRSVSQRVAGDRRRRQAAADFSNCWSLGSRALKMLPLVSIKN